MNRLVNLQLCLHEGLLRFLIEAKDLKIVRADFFLLFIECLDFVGTFIIHFKSSHDDVLIHAHKYNKLSFAIALATLRITKKLYSWQRNN